MAAPQRLTDRKRVAIVDAAIAEFREHGFDATSMDRIAATAAVSKRTVYNHFPSKDELFAEILRRMWESSVAQPAVPYLADQPLRPQVLALVEQKMGLLCDPAFIDLARVIFGETIHSPARAQAMVARLNEKETGLYLWIRAAQQDGRIKAGETVEVAHLLMSPLKPLHSGHKSPSVSLCWARHAGAKWRNWPSISSCATTAWQNRRHKRAASGQRWSANARPRRSNTSAARRRRHD